MSVGALPLDGVHVVELADGRGELCGRILADLGANVIRVEAPGGAEARGRGALGFAIRNARKRSVTLDISDPRDLGRLERLLDRADILIGDAPRGQLGSLLARHPELVVVSISDFGESGPYQDWIGTDAVHLALSGVLARSGLPGEPPLLPPPGLVEHSAAVQATWAALLAYFARLHSGFGDRVEVSIHEATLQIIDPGFGMGGTGAAGVAPKDLPRGRPDAAHVYPVFRCADGHVRICVLAPRQWHALRAWLGEPHEFADVRYDALPARFAAAERLQPLIAELFAARTQAELVEEGQRRGVPIAAVLTPAQALAADHFAVRGAFADVEVGDGSRARIPAGYVEVDGARAGLRAAAPEPGEHRGAAPEPGEDGDTGSTEAEAVPRAAAHAGDPDGEIGRPLEGLRVLDLGVIVLGAEAGRLLADQGADVVKVENRRFPDGARQSYRGEGMSIGFAYGHRGKRSLALDLRRPDGAAIFKRLVREADVVLSNFKPGTLESLGLGYEALATVNPKIVVAESSAFGATGPWSRRMGYGPLVRASTGLTSLWRYGEKEGGFGDAMTVYPDHAAARVVALATLALIVRRRRTGRGGRVTVSQAETILMALSETLASERDGVSASSAVYPCEGDDEWVAITIRDDEDRRRLDELAAGRPLREWTQQHAPREAMALLQAAGVPAGAMLRVAELPDDPQLIARGFFGLLEQPQLEEPLLCERGPARFRRLPDPELRPAPLVGEHTRAVCREWLAMDDAEVDELVAAGVLEELAAEVPA